MSDIVDEMVLYGMRRETAQTLLDAHDAEVRAKAFKELMEAWEDSEDEIFTTMEVAAAIRNRIDESS